MSFFNNKPALLFQSRLSLNLTNRLECFQAKNVPSPVYLRTRLSLCRSIVEGIGVVVAHALHEADPLVVVIEHDVVVPHHVRPEHAAHRLRQINPARYAAVVRFEQQKAEHRRTEARGVV